MAAKSGSNTIEDVLGESDGLTIEQAMAGADPHGEIEAAVRNAGSLTTGGGNPYSPGLPEAASGAVEFTKEPGRFLLRRVPTMIAALAGNMIGGKVMEKIPALAGIGWKQALGRIGLLSGGEAAGAGLGDLTGQYLAGDEVDPAKAGLAAAIQGGLGAANSATAAGGGKAGAVSTGAVEAGMGRPGFAKAPNPAEYVKVARDIHAGFEPTSPGRVDLEGTIQSFDNQDFHVEGGKLLDAMERGLPSGSAPENIGARSKLVGEIENHRAEIERLAQKHRIDPVRVLGAPAVNIPGSTTVIPETRIRAIQPRMAAAQTSRMQGAPAVAIPGSSVVTPETRIRAVLPQRGVGADPYGFATPDVDVPGGVNMGDNFVMAEPGFRIPGRTPNMQGAPETIIPGMTTVIPDVNIPAVAAQDIPPHLRYAYRGAPEGPVFLGGPACGGMQGAPETIIPGMTTVIPDVNILPSPEVLIPPDLRAAVGRALGQAPRSGTGNMRFPLTGRQADSFIRQNLTAPIAEDLAGNPGGTEYAGARKALRGRVASEFYDQLGIGASESAKRAKNVLDVKDLVADKYFPVDERGVPKPSSAGRVAAVGRNNSPEDAVYREHLQSIDEALGTKFVAIADQLAQKQEWSPNDQREAAFLLDAYRATTGRVVTTGGFRGFLRLIGRTALRSQGKTGALIRGAAAGDISDRIRPDKEKRRIGPTP